MKARFIKSVIAASKKEEVRLPFARGAERAARIAARREDAQRIARRA